MELLQIAVTQGAGIETIERLAALQDKMLAREGELAFNAAMNRAQTALGPVGADLTNPQTKSKYASYQALDRAIRPVYSREGFSLSFDTADSPLAEHARVLCYVSHASGHTRTYHIDMPNDGKGAKGGDVMTKTHAQGAAMSYGMRYLLKMIFNIAVGEDDTDGNSYTDLSATLERIAQATAFNLQEIYQSAVKAAFAAKDFAAVKKIVEAKDARKRAL